MSSFPAAISATAREILRVTKVRPRRGDSGRTDGEDDEDEFLFQVEDIVQKEDKPWLKS